MPWADYQQSFYDSMYPLARQASSATGIDADIIFAQAALESNWGRNVVGNNYFGIKGEGFTTSTQEYIDGKYVSVKDNFKKFMDAADSVKGYINFILSNKRYDSVRRASGESAQLDALQSSGYATDPNYSSKLKSIIGNLPNNFMNTLRLYERKGLEAIGVSSQTAEALTDPNTSIGEVATGVVISGLSRYVVIGIGIILVGLAIAALVLKSDPVTALQKGIQ